jgi:zinc protease
LNESYLNDISLEKIQQVYTDRIKDASDFTFFIVGNIEQETAKTMAQKYIGSIKSEYRDEKWVDNKVRGPKGKMVKRVGIKMEEPKSTVFVRLSNDKVKVTPYDQICFSVLQGVLQLRYTESIREEEGGTYGVRVGASSSREPTPNYVLEMSFNCEPERADALKPILYSELETIAKKGPKQEELDKTLENIRKNREQSKPHNAYWMNVIYNYYRTGVNNDDPKNFENIVDKITVKDIRKWLRKFKRKADVVDIIFYPE